MSLTDTVPPSPALIGVSLKMYFGVDEACSWAERVAAIARAHPAVAGGSTTVFVLPSLPAVSRVREALGDAPVGLGAQDLFWEDRGAYTGGVSGADLVDLGCSFVEVGHAEQRRYLGDDDKTIAAKTAAALRNDLTPVLCIGETDELPATSAATECTERLERILSRVPDTGHAPGSVIVAYEPEWAIGGMVSAEPTHIRHVTGALREVLHACGWVDSGHVIYGGSAQPGLLPRLSGAVDGLFLGRYAHDPEVLGEILDETMSLR